jgi:hypothetical protein
MATIVDLSTISTDEVYSKLEKEDLFWNFDVLRTLTEDTVPRHQFVKQDYIDVLKQIKNANFIKKDDFDILKKLFNHNLYAKDLIFSPYDKMEIEQFNTAKNYLEYIYKP